MNGILWFFQVALAWLSIAGGAFQIFKIDELRQTVEAMRSLPTSLWAVFGVIGCIAGLCLIVPGLLKARPALTGYAAVVIALESLVITGLYLHFGDKAPVPFSLTMVGMAAFISYGRLVARPL